VIAGTSRVVGRWLLWVLLVTCALCGRVEAADVLFDGSIGPHPDGASARAPSDPRAEYVIDEADGLSNGVNLFHSFRQFDLGAGEVALFTGSASIQNVISRVTGGTRSEIAGMIRSEVGAANFFLMNPSGITFLQDGGDNDPKIEVPGSFFASTADRLLFDDGKTFSALPGVETPAEILSTTSAPSAWGFLGGGAGVITTDQRLEVSNDSILSFVASDFVTGRSPAGTRCLDGGGRAGWLPRRHRHSR